MSRNQTTNKAYRVVQGTVQSRYGKFPTHITVSNHRLDMVIRLEEYDGFSKGLRELYEEGKLGGTYMGVWHVKKK